MTDVAARPRLLASWRFVLRTGNPPRGPLDPVSRWLVLTRAVVLPMSMTAAAVAGLLAVPHPAFNAGWFALAAAGVTLAHVANNLMNDLFDLGTGLDTSTYPRALYAPHPVLSGMITRGGLARAAALVNAIDLAILLALVAARGWPVLAFALAGFFVSAAYTAPPVRLKKRGLGEPGVFLVWGPLMVGGTYYAATGTLPAGIVWASLPYGLLCTAVLMGKHIDKIPWDGPAGIRTLPVLLGEARARRATQALMAGFYATIVILVATLTLPPFALIAFGALPHLVKVWPAYARPKPAEPPGNYPIWPLWFAPHAFLHTRRAGALLVVGLALSAVFPDVRLS